MLTIEEIKNISFRKAKKSGYSAEDVDRFIDNVVATVENYNSEKVEIMKKIDFLAKKLEKYRADEDIVKNALIRSEKISKDTISEATIKAENIINEAKAKADEIVKSAQTKAYDTILNVNNATLAQKNELVALEATATEFRKQIINLYNEQIKAVNNMQNKMSVKVSKEELDKKYADIEEQNNYIEQNPKKEPKLEVIVDERPVINAEDKIINLNNNEKLDTDNISLDKTQSFSLKNRNFEEKTESKKIETKTENKAEPEKTAKNLKKKKDKKDKKERKFFNLKFGTDYDFEP